jgi:hypothetical protein
MKTRCLFKIIVLLGLFLSIKDLRAQAPHSFKYQAILRNAAGEVLTNHAVAVRISLLKGSETGDPVYTETHQGTTNNAGMLVLNIGGGVDAQGLAGIDWSAGPYYLKMEIDPEGGTSYQDMGTSPLLSVPYALYSGGSDGWSTASNGIFRQGNVGVGETDPQSLLEIKASPGGALEEALFVVKNNIGDTVFAVYNEGVRITVPEGSKGGKGGFAVGGRSGTKGPVSEIFRVTPDSVRIWVNSAGSVKGGKGGFAVGGRSSKGAADNYVTLTPENYYIGHQSGLKNTTGYYNTFFGYHAGAYNSTGSNNIMIGNESGYYNTDGASNVFIGSNTGYNSSYPYYDIFIGRASGYNNTTGYSNIFIGDGTGYYNKTGNQNVYIGDYSGRGSETASNNVFLGAYSGTGSTGTYNIGIGPYAGAYSDADSNNIFIGLNSGKNHSAGINNVFIGPNTGAGFEESGDNNVFIGSSVGNENSTGYNNVFLGSESGMKNTTGFYNVFIGNRAGYSNTSGYSNVLLGENTGYSLTSGHWNVLLGNYTGHGLTSGSGNIFMGDHTGSALTDASFNVIIGDYSALSKTSGNYNVILGASAGSTNTTGSSNIFLGYGAGYYETGSNKLYIENSTADASNALVYGEFDNNIFRVNGNMGINSTGYTGYGLVLGLPSGQTENYTLWVYGSGYATGSFYSASDARWKKNINDLPFKLNDLHKLRTVTYEWNREDYPDMRFSEGTEIGILAQDLEKVFPALVKTDQKGFKSVDYSKLSVVLLKAVQDQQDVIDKQQSQISDLISRVKSLEEKK